MTRATRGTRRERFTCSTAASWKRAPQSPPPDPPAGRASDDRMDRRPPEPHDRGEHARGKPAPPIQVTDRAARAGTRRSAPDRSFASGDLARAHIDAPVNLQE